MPAISRLPQVLGCLSLSSSSPLKLQQYPTFQFSLSTPSSSSSSSSSSSLYHFKFRPKRFHFLTTCSSLKETKKQQTLSKVPSAAPPPQGLKRLLNLSPKDDDDGGGDSTAVTGTILAGLLLVGLVGGFGAVGYFYRDQINSFFTQFLGSLKQEESDVGLPGGNGQLLTLGLGLLFTALAATYVTRIL